MANRAPTFRSKVRPASALDFDFKPPSNAGAADQPVKSTNVLHVACYQMKLSFSSACVALTAAFLTPATHAQQLYRCGNTFSQTPCSVGASTVRVSPTATPDAPPGPSGKELCNSAAPRLLPLNDPDKARIESVVKGSAEVIQYAGQPIAAHKYIVSINDVNAYGVYLGARPYACYLSEDERRVLKVALVGS